MQILLTKILKWNSRISKESESPSKKIRKCSVCGEEKPLDSDHYQVVKYFKEKFSFYCNECAKPKPRE
jgi:hypothetical protein